MKDEQPCRARVVADGVTAKCIYGASHRMDHEAELRRKGRTPRIVWLSWTNKRGPR